MLANISATKSMSPINDFSISNIEGSPDTAHNKSKEEITEYNKELQWALKMLKEENDQLKLQHKISNPDISVSAASPD